MVSKKNIDFRQFYIQEFLTSAAELVGDNLQDENRVHLKELLVNLRTGDEIGQGIEKLAQEQGSSELSIYLFDIIDRIGDYPPSMAYDALPDIVEDFVNATGLMIEESDTIEAVKKVNRRLKGEEEEIPEEIDTEEFETVEEPQVEEEEQEDQADSLPLTKFAEEYLFEKLNNQFPVDNNDQLIRFTRILLDEDHKSIPAEMNDLRSSIIKIAPWQSGTEFSAKSFMEMLDQHVSEFTRHIVEFAKNRADVISASINEGKLIFAAVEETHYQKEEIPEEPTTIDSILNEYFLSEIDEHLTKIYTSLEELKYSPKDRKILKRLIEEFNSFKEINMIHGYPVIENFSAEVIQDLQSGYHKRKKFNWEMVEIFQRIFETLKSPDQLKDIKKHTPASKRLNGYLTEVRSKIWARPVHKMPVETAEETITIADTEKLTNAFGEVLQKSADSITQKISNSQDTQSALLRLAEFEKSSTLINRKDIAEVFGVFVKSATQMSESGHEAGWANHIGENFKEFVAQFPAQTDSSEWKKRLIYQVTDTEFSMADIEHIVSVLVEIEQKNRGNFEVNLQNFFSKGNEQTGIQQRNHFKRLGENLRLIGAEKSIAFAEFYSDLFNFEQYKELTTEKQLELSQSYKMFLDGLKNNGLDNDPSELLEVVQEIIGEEKTEADIEEVEEAVELEDDEDLNEIFRQEAFNYLDHADVSLEQLKTNPDKTDLIREIERSVHSLKASARLMGYGQVGDLAGPVESLCEKLLAVNVTNIDEIIPVISEGLHSLRAAVEDKEVDAEGLTQKISSVEIQGSEKTFDTKTPSESLDEKPLFSTSPSEDEDLLDIFKEESAEFIGVIERANDNLKTDRQDKTSLDELENASHSLKSAAKMLGFREIGEIGDAIEQVIEGVKHSEIRNTELVNQLIGDALIMIKDLTAGQQLDPQNFAQLVNAMEIKNLQKKQIDSGDETDTTFFVQEGQDLLDLINADLLVLEKSPDDSQLFQNLSRNVHTLKGGAQIVGLENIGSIAHLIEDFFDRRKDISQAELDVIFKGVDEIQNLVNAVKAGNRDENATYGSVISNLKNGLKKTTAETKVKTADLADMKSVRIDTAAEHPPDTEQVIKITTEKLDNLINMAAELVINKSQLTNYLEKLKEISSQIDTDKRKLQSSTDAIDSFLTKIKSEKETSDDTEEVVNLSSISDDFKKVLDTFEDVTSNFKNITQHFELNLGQISSLTKLLHDDILQVRMVPTEMLFSRFARAVRDLSRKQKKKVNLVVEGETTEMDRAMVESLTDPVMHLVRNAIDHGIETPKERKEKNKKEDGILLLRAMRDKNHIMIEVQDDGRGIDPEVIKKAIVRKKLAKKAEAAKMTQAEIMQFIFQPGFTTKRGASKVSGRGIGLDVVVENLRQIKGDVAINSTPDKGTIFTIRVPLTLAITQVMLIESQGEILAVPLAAVDETIEVKTKAIEEKENRQFITIHDNQIPLVEIKRFLKYESDRDIEAPKQRHAILVNQKTNGYALLVDKVLRREEIVVKALGEELNNLEFISGGTILGDGKVVLILDIGAITRVIEREYFEDSSDFAPLEIARKIVSDEKQEESKVPIAKKSAVVKKVITDRSPVALIVDDSLSVRKFVSSVLERNNYETKLANDGTDAVVAIESQDFDIIITDLEMPQMHGFDLIEKIRSQEHFDEIPIVILTGKAAKENKEKGLKLGANAYIIKPFKENDLLKTLEEFIEV
jgi:chemotaxis protein histidine kinase CheA/CheY-like chemotaxis protein